MKTKKIKHRIERLTKVKDALELNHKRFETSVYNYYAGWDLGYVQGQLSILEDLLDEN